MLSTVRTYYYTHTRNRLQHYSLSLCRLHYARFDFVFISFFSFRSTKSIKLSNCSNFTAHLWTITIMFPQIIAHKKCVAFNCRGQLPDEAEMHYLENAKNMALYGTHMHNAIVSILIQNSARMSQQYSQNSLNISVHSHGNVYFFVKISDYSASFDKPVLTISLYLLSHQCCTC